MRTTKLMLHGLFFAAISLFFISSCGIPVTGTNSEINGTNQQEPAETNPIPLSSNDKLEQETDIVESSSVGYDKTTLTLSKAPSVNETLNINYSIEPLAQDYLSFDRVWIEFERYDPAIQYPLGRGIVKNELLEYLADKSGSMDPYYLYIESLSEKQPRSLVPEDSVLLTGKLELESNQVQNKEKIQTTGTIKFPQAGEWLISLKSQTTGKSPVLRESIELTISDKTGTKGWPHNYQPNRGETVLGDGNIFKVDLTISKAPALSEETEMVCTIKSIEDVKDVTVNFLFTLMQEQGYQKNKYLPEDIILTEDKSWQGDIYKDRPVQILLTIKLPKTGDWEIGAYGTSPDSKYDTSSWIFLNVDNDQGRIGWSEPHDRKQDIPIEPYKG